MLVGDSLHIMRDKMKILFLCTGNSCRSQMAEGWARYLKSDFIQPFSAGIEAHGLNLNAVKVMQEEGVDITQQKSQRIEEVETIPIDSLKTYLTEMISKTLSGPVIAA